MTQDRHRTGRAPASDEGDYDPGIFFRPIPWKVLLALVILVALLIGLARIVYSGLFEGIPD